MSLAQVHLSPSDFQTIYDHLVSHYPEYRNMHLRESYGKTKTRPRSLRYLHAMKATEGSDREIEGMISGPAVFCHYRITARTRPQITAIEEWVDPKELARIRNRFVDDILGRIAEEKDGNTHRPKYSTGNFYLKRAPVGMGADHPNCRAAVEQGVLDEEFVERFETWNLTLVHPRAGRRRRAPSSTS